MSKVKPYFVALRIDIDEEKYPHPNEWDWGALLDLPSSGGVEVLAAQEITLLGDKEDDDE